MVTLLLPFNRCQTTHARNGATRAVLSLLAWGTPGDRKHGAEASLTLTAPGSDSFTALLARFVCSSF